MEKQIKRVVKKLKISYIIFWAVTILLVVIGETEFFPIGLLADDVRTFIFSKRQGYYSRLFVFLFL